MMSVQWTAEQVLALAPDAASAKNGRGLASRRKWVSLGSGPSIVWGECQGSGKDPYRTQIDLREPAFRCSCPSRKFPCKHGLGLFLILVESPTEFVETDPPTWVTDWLATRSQKVEKQAEKQAKQQQQAADPEAQAKRSLARQQKVSAGVQELRRWLEDRIRQGLATVPQESYQFWDNVAARMVDAQAPGLARHLRDCAGIIHSGTGWSDRLLARMGGIYLLTEGFHHLESLPPSVQADVRTQIGWTMNQDEVLKEPAQADLWLVVGQQTEVEERLKVRRTWLYGLGKANFALLLEFAHGKQPFEYSLFPGTCLEAELVFYPSAYPLRALIKNRQEAVLLKQNPPGMNIHQAIGTYHQGFAQCPWLEQFPMLLQAVVPFQEQGIGFIRDEQGMLIPLSPHLDAKQVWQLLALSGGYPLTLFGEWNGSSLVPLQVWVEEECYGLG
ncbi:MAG: SWIM zinc finger family protein [Leptolyngbyaceae cyanobacterium bins.59]|nr:SWIM zinc finger family protein [Leptolyngbyaceae cyanobacterium bins.59]